MGKLTSYFPHDDNARNDEKILHLISKFGLSGYGLYWCIIEIMAQSKNGYVPRENLMIMAGGMHTQCRHLSTVVDFAVASSLLRENSEGLYSPRMIDHKKHRKFLSDMGKEGAKRKWEGHSHPISHPDSSKVKERKVKQLCAKEFDIFWSVYPKKVGKAPAMASFNRLSLEDGLLEKILAAVEKQKNTDQWAKDGGQYIPMPATWINQRRWEDEGVQLPQVKKHKGPELKGAETYGKI